LFYTKVGVARPRLMPLTASSFLTAPGQAVGAGPRQLDSTARLLQVGNHVSFMQCGG